MNITDFWYADEAKDGEIQQILSHIVDCHKLMIVENRKVKNDEDVIRYVFTNDYLGNSKIRRKLGITGYIFQPESPVTDENYKAIGWVDIKVYLPQYDGDDKKVYFVECKRLDGNSKLNKYYIQGGVLRFISGKYQSYFGSNGMLAFCVKTFDIESNTLKINEYIDKLCISNTHDKLTKNVFLDDSSHTYVSKHSLQLDTNSRFSLYHLMLDFSAMIDTSV